MPKGKMSDERKRVLSEQAKARWAAKRAEMPSAEEHFDTKPEPGPVPGVQPNANNADYGDLARRIQELEGLLKQQNGMSQNMGMQTNGRGGLVGTFERYIVDPANYPDPCARLAQESRLQRFAFPQNYELKFDVAVTSYQTKDGVNTKEPKFTLELNKIVYDEETGEPTNGRYVVCRAIFHEDPEAALVVARDNGFEVASVNEKTFLDEMRYLRMRDWLLEAFYAPRPTKVTNKKEMVVGNRLVEYFEISSEDSQTIPFAQLKTKL